MTQQNETLNEFMARRMTELGLGYKDLNEVIGGQTQANIRSGRVTGLREETKQKLALLLQCSQGDINAAIANTVQITKTGEVVIRKNSEPSAMEPVDSSDNGTKPQNSGTIPEEIDEKSFENGTISDDTSNDSAEPTAGTWDFNCIENAKTKPKTKKIKRTDITAPKVQAKAVSGEVKDLTVEEYRQQLKDMCLQQFLIYGRPAQVETVYAAIGEKLVKELLGK